MSDSNNNSQNDHKFLEICKAQAANSDDPKTKVGACIVNSQGQVVGKGYNCMPRRCEDFPWKPRKTSDPMNNKHLYVCHAELNAITNTNKNKTADIEGCTIYVTLFPCNECTKLIIQNGITQVVYLSDKNCDKIENTAAKRMLEKAGVTYRKFNITNISE